MLESLQKMLVLFQALADPARLSMLERLGERARSVGELAAPLPMTLAAVVQHVQVLERSGLVITEKTGRTRMCRLSADGLALLHEWVEDQRTRAEKPVGLAFTPTAPPVQDAEASPSDAVPRLRRARHHPRLRKAAFRAG